MSETQAVETISNPVVDNSYSEAPMIENESSPEPVKEEASPSTEVAPNESGDGELPEFAKRRLGKEQKKYERQIAQMRTELEAEKARNASFAQAPQAQWGGNPGVYQDPITKESIDTSTPEGQAIYNYHQKMSQALAAQDKEQLAQQAKEVENKLHEHFESSFDDAAEKHADFDKVIKGAGMNLALGRELAYFPDPGELGYYLASNPREVDRLQKLPAYEMKRELARHMAEMVSKNNVTRTPAPVKPIGVTSGSPVKHFAQKTIAELKAERKAELSGQTPRGRR